VKEAALTEKSWKNLRSGSDIRGIGTGDGNNPLFLNDRKVERITVGFAVWLSKNINKGIADLTVSVGHDPRVSSLRIKNAVIAALSGLGAVVIDCGLSSTPAMFMTTVDLKCDGAVQITASHHPSDRNGMKFFTRVGGLESVHIDEVLDYAQTAGVPAAESAGAVEKADYMNTYAAALREMICRQVNDTDYLRPLRGYKIVVDAGNGAGGFYAAKVLEPLGADIGGSCFLNPDGTFPNHIPNPENKQAMESIRKAVTDNDADLGIIFDTDVDRAGCVGKGGLVINRNRLIALAAAIVLEDNEGATVVTDSITSDGLTEFIKNNGGVHLRYKRGYKNVIDKQMELTESGVNCPLAMETSGHAAFRDNYFLDDGAYLVTRIVIKMAVLGKQGKNLESLVESLRIPLEEQEVRLAIQTEDFKAFGDLVIGELASLADQREGWAAVTDNYEGIRVSTDKNSGDGWFLARLSVHDPVLVINAESDSSGGTALMLKNLLDFFHRYSGLDTRELEQAAAK